MRVLVCGGRDYADIDRLVATLDCVLEEAVLAGDPVDTVITGMARGADRLAALWGHDRGLAVEEYTADWNKHGKGAGPIRNQRMLDEGKPDMVIAFPGGRGTADMLRRARAAGVPTQEMAERRPTSATPKEPDAQR